MPFKSQEQETYLRINEPEIHQRWVDNYGHYNESESFSAEHKRRGGSGAYCVCGAQIRRKKLTNGRYISVCGRSGVRIPPGLPPKKAESFAAEGKGSMKESTIRKRLLTAAKRTEPSQNHWFTHLGLQMLFEDAGYKQIPNRGIALSSALQNLINDGFMESKASKEGDIIFRFLKWDGDWSGTALADGSSCSICGFTEMCGTENCDLCVRCCESSDDWGAETATEQGLGTRFLGAICQCGGVVEEVDTECDLCGKHYGDSGADTLYKCRGGCDMTFCRQCMNNDALVVGVRKGGCDFCHGRYDDKDLWPINHPGGPYEDSYRHRIGLHTRICRKCFNSYWGNCEDCGTGGYGNDCECRKNRVDDTYAHYQPMHPIEVPLFEAESFAADGTIPPSPFLDPDYCRVIGSGKYRFNQYDTDGKAWRQYRFKTKDEAMESLSGRTLPLGMVKPGQDQYDFPPKQAESFSADWKSIRSNDEHFKQSPCYEVCEICEGSLCNEGDSYTIIRLDGKEATICGSVNCVDAWYWDNLAHARDSVSISKYDIEMYEQHFSAESFSAEGNYLTPCPLCGWWNEANEPCGYHGKLTKNDLKCDSCGNSAIGVKQGTYIPTCSSCSMNRYITSFHPFGAESFSADSKVKMCRICEESFIPTRRGETRCNECRKALYKRWFNPRPAESFSAENRCSVCGASSHNERSCPYGPDTSFTTNLPRTLGIMGMVAVIAGGAYIWTQRATNGGKQDE